MADMNLIFGNSFSLGEKSLDYLWTKQTVIANNIANNDTPGFKSQYVTFEEELKSKLKHVKPYFTSSKIGDAINDSEITINQTETESTRLDGNNVQVEAEYIEQARAYLQYEYQALAVKSNITQLRAAIKN